MPDNLESCLALIDLYKQLNDNRAALEVTDRYLAFYDHQAATGQEGERDLRVPVLKFMIHYDLGEYDACLAVGMPILGNADLRPYEKRVRQELLSNSIAPLLTSCRFARKVMVLDARAARKQARGKRKKTKKQKRKITCLVIVKTRMRRKRSL